VACRRKLPEGLQRLDPVAAGDAHLYGRPERRARLRRLERCLLGHGACSGTAPTCSITGDGTATAKFDPLVGTPPAPPTPPADPGTAPGGGSGIVDAEIVDTWFKRSKRGLRLLKVEILAGEPVHVLGLRPAP
jgi:hypothetical protein